MKTFLFPAVSCSTFSFSMETWTLYDKRCEEVVILRKIFFYACKNPKKNQFKLLHLTWQSKWKRKVISCTKQYA